MELSGASAKSMAAGANFYRDLSGMPAKSGKVGKAARAARRAKAKMKAGKGAGTGPWNCPLVLKVSLTIYLDPKNTEEHLAVRTE